MDAPLAPLFIGVFYGPASVADLSAEMPLRPPYFVRIQVCSSGFLSALEAGIY